MSNTTVSITQKHEEEVAALYAEVKSAKMWVHPDADVNAVAQALERLVASKRVKELSINTVNSVAVYRSEMAAALTRAGFSATVRGFKRYQN